MKRFRLVMVEWEDSEQPVSAWQWLSDITARRPMRIRSVGWLIRDEADAKVLAPNIGFLDEAQASGIIRIPARCVVAIRNLKEPVARKRNGKR